MLMMRGAINMPLLTELKAGDFNCSIRSKRRIAAAYMIDYR